MATAKFVALTIFFLAGTGWLAGVLWWMFHRRPPADEHRPLADEEIGY